MEKKSATIFDFIDGLTHKKTEWNKWSETDQKLFTPFITNRWLSMRMELVDLVNTLQKYTIGTLTPKMTYRLYYEVMPASKGFAKYIKGSKEDKFNTKLINQVAEHYQVSKSEATEYIELMDQSSCAKLLSLYGYTEAEIKTLTKGLK
jgi:hypothetical protein